MISSGWGFMRQTANLKLSAMCGVWENRDGGSKVVLGKEKAACGQVKGAVPRSCVLAARADWCHCSPVVTWSSPKPQKSLGQERGKWAGIPSPSPVLFVCSVLLWQCRESCDQLQVPLERGEQWHQQQGAEKWQTGDGSCLCSLMQILLLLLKEKNPPFSSSHVCTPELDLTAQWAGSGEWAGW